MAQASLWSVSFYVDGLKKKKKKKKKKLIILCHASGLGKNIQIKCGQYINIMLVMPHRVTNIRAGRNRQVCVSVQIG